MRLIDVDEYKDYIIDSLEGYKLLTNEYRDFARDIIRGFLKDIDAQPTAYDVDKVIKQLGKVSFIDVDEEYADDGQRMLFLHDAIEIVKRGGTK